MKLSYDKDADALAIEFKKGKVVEDRAISDDVFAGYGKNGELLGLQVLELSSHPDTFLTVELVA